MTDWTSLLPDAVKIISGAILGSAGTALQVRRQRRNVRRKLYNEIARNVETLLGLRPLIGLGESTDADVKWSGELAGRLDFDYYRYVYSQRHDVLSELPDYQVIVKVADAFANLAGALGTHFLARTAKHTYEAVEVLVRSGELDPKLLAKSGGPFVRQLVADSRAIRQRDERAVVG